MNQRSYKSPTVSVIIPCYNHAEYLSEAIESAKNQDYLNVEVVVVDDGSTDATPEVARQYSGVRYIRQENKGLAAARNAGLERSSGSFIIFVDADDRLLPGAVWAGLECFEENPECAFVYGGFRWVTEEGDIAEPPSSRVQSGRSVYERMLGGNFISMHASVMYRREPLVVSGGFDTSLPACEDYDIFLRIAREGEVAGHTTQVAEYRQHSSNMSSDGRLIVTSALTVLNRQWKHVRRDAQLKKAFMDGGDFWVRKYRDTGFWQASEWHITGTSRQRLKDVTTLARISPFWFMRKTARRVYGGARAIARRIRSAGRDEPVLRTPPPGNVRFGDLRRRQPLDRYFGYGRGLPVDRFYIERFLQNHSASIRGRTLEIKDATYIRRFGGSKVESIDVLDIDASNPLATIVADLARPDALPENAYDCILLTQTLQLVFDINTALDNIYRALKPGGTLLLTAPGITKTDESSPWYWTFTGHSIRRLLAMRFSATDVEIESYGNVLAATAFLQGIAADELRPDEIDFRDSDYPVSILARATKAEKAA